MQNQKDILCKFGIFFLKKYKIVSASLDSKLLLASVLYDKLKKNINNREEIENSFLQLLVRRATGESVATIINQKSFWKHTFYVNKHTLDPRPATELIIETSLKYHQNKKQSLSILDLGTGSGCILLSLLAEYTNAKGIGIDTSKKALEIAKKNAHIMRLTNRANFFISRWDNTEKVQSFVKNKNLDLIVANPPYIKSSICYQLDKGVIKSDPYISINGGSNGIKNYFSIFALARKLLKKNGLLICEIGYDQVYQLLCASPQYNLQCIAKYKDLERHPRCLVFKVLH